MSAMAEMMARHARTGRLDWIGLRPARRAEPAAVAAARIGPEGLEGDHGRAGKRAVTLIQAEHLPVIEALLGRGGVSWADLRRNLVVSGINLAALRKRAVLVGDARLLVEGPCPPCSRMEERLGPGGYSALRGHGGYYASVIEGGDISLGAAVRSG